MTSIFTMNNKSDENFVCYVHVYVHRRCVYTVAECESRFEMSLLCFLKPKDGLPDPRGARSPRPYLPWQVPDHPPAPFYSHGVPIHCVPWLSFTSEYLTSSCFPNLAINMVAPNTAGSSVNVFDHARHHVY